MNAKSIFAFGLSLAVPLTLLLGIWAHRNYVELGSPVLLRSNAGLELALANHQSALEGGDDLRKIYVDRLEGIHPFFQPVPRYTYLLYPILLFSLASLRQRRAERRQAVRAGFGMTTVGAVAAAGR